jgi:hypothetical protein
MAITINGSGTVTGISVGGLPDGIVDTDMMADTYSGGAITIGGLRIMHGSFTLTNDASSTSDSFGVSCQKYINHTASNVLSGYNAAPFVTAALDTDHHEAKVAYVRDVSTTGFIVCVSCSRDSGIESKTLRWLAIGDAS